MKEIVFATELKSIKPERPINQNTGDIVEEFFLTLGLIFNDLKDLTILTILVNNHFDDTDLSKLSVETGEHNGIIQHIQRLVISALHEFILFLDKNKEVLETEEFKLLYNKLNADQKKLWDQLIQIATNDSLTELGEDFLNILLRIRNNISSHYYQSGKQLRNGYIGRFFSKEKDFGNKKAYYSLEGSMNNSRIFYSDAAAQGLYDNLIDKKMDSKIFNSELNNLFEKVNFAILSIMKIYIKNLPQK